MHVLLLDRLDQQITAALSNPELEPFDPDEERAAFEDALYAEPDAVDADKSVLMHALGLR